MNSDVCTDPPWRDVYCGLGSNLGDPAFNLAHALAFLDRLPGTTLVAHSSLYRTKPVGPPQPDYLNAVCALRTRLSPRALLQACKAYERQRGRREGPRWGPRVIDVDILLYGRHEMHGGDLTIPHPELGRRGFVLVPLAEIAPDLRPPGVPWTIQARAMDVGEQGVIRLDGDQQPGAWKRELDITPWFARSTRTFP